jgi:hypothetical protein
VTSSSAGIRVTLPIPSGWVPAELSPPDLASAEQVHVLTWQAWRPPGIPPEGPALVTACFAGRTSAWTPEAEPVVLERLGAVVSSTALRVSKVGQRRVASTEHLGAMTSERLEGVGDAADRLVAKTFLGFVDAGDGSPGSLAGCFALCTMDLPACEPSVERAGVDAAFVAPPPPTLAVRAVVAMAHHPSLSAASALTLSLLAGVIAVATRRRPRTK